MAFSSLLRGDIRMQNPKNNVLVSVFEEIKLFDSFLHKMFIFILKNVR